MRLETELAKTEAGRQRLMKAFWRAMSAGQAQEAREEGAGATTAATAATAAPAAASSSGAGGTGATTAATAATAAPAAASGAGGTRATAAAVAATAAPAVASGVPAAAGASGAAAPPAQGPTLADRDGSEMDTSPPSRKRQIEIQAPGAEGDMDTAMVAASGLHADAVALVEAYSLARPQRKAGAFGLHAGVAMDLRLGWDLGRDGEQHEAQGRLDLEKPYLLVLGPMWLGPFQLHELSAHPRRLQELLETDRKHLEFACALARQQIARGGRVLFELPWEAASWSEECIVEMLATSGMQRVRCDQCLFGQVSADGSGQVGPARRETWFITNDPFIARAAARRCHGGREHVQSLGARAKTCEKYPPLLVAEILRALRSSTRAAGGGAAERMLGNDRELTISAVEAGPVLEEPELLARPATTEEEKVFRDRCTGLPLDPERVRSARAEEMRYIEELKVLELSDHETCIQETGSPPIPTDWVDIDKGDPSRPNYRSRLVARETRRRTTIDADDWAATFAATPPYEAFRLQLSLLMTGPRPENLNDEEVLMLLDISRAHLHSPLNRVVFVRIGGQVYRLLKAMYGLRDAGASGDSVVRGVRWGDDFPLSGKRLHCAEFRGELGKRLLVKHTATLGPNPEHGDVGEATSLNRIVRWPPLGSEVGERVELEADPRHAEILYQQLGLGEERSKAAATPGVKPTGDDDDDDGRELDPEARSNYISWAMRASYLAQDRCELQFACKELARRMQAPRQKDMQALKRLGRFLKGAPRCLVVCRRQADQTVVDVFSDSDWAGCRKTPRSTSSSYTILGQHLITTSSTTQDVVATSSGEAEFYALTESASRAIGTVAMAADLFKVLKPRVRVDASSSK
ncbi:unnamed protein product, partial [Prorocentrum cordatum]